MDNTVTRSDDEFFNIKFLQKYLLKTNGFIAGGCFKNIFNQEKIKDIDIFFRDEADFKDAVNVYKKNKDFEFYYKNKNVVAYKEKLTNIVVELIKKGFYDPEEILDDFDFSITKFCYFFKVEKDEEEGLSYEYSVIHHKDFFEHLHMKKLVLDSEKLIYPYGTFERTLRYTTYGYRMCRESKKKLIKSIRSEESFNEMDLTKSFYDGFD